MIRTARQLKALVRNLSKGNSTQAQIIIRNFITERFLERLSLSEYKDNFIIKGGMLVSAMVGLDARSTMDLDTTITNMPLISETIQSIIEKVISLPIDDGVVFSIRSINPIMEDTDYGGIRASLEAEFDTMRVPLKLDISTGDVITPREIAFPLKLMFEDRTISIWAYNIETVLAEKLETVISRSTANTRLRDFYDLYILRDRLQQNEMHSFASALKATCDKRGTSLVVSDGVHILDEIRNSQVMMLLWHKYQIKYRYAEGVSWTKVMDTIDYLFATAWK